MELRGQAVHVDVVPSVRAHDREHLARERAAREDEQPFGSGRGHVGNASCSTNRSLKSGPVRELDVANLLEHGLRRVPLLERQQRHLRTFARDIARRDDPWQGQLRDEADADGAGGGEVGAERAGEEHLLDLVDDDPELLDEQPPAGGDRCLGELQLADVALGQVNGSVGVVFTGRPVQDEHPRPVAPRR